MDTTDSFFDQPPGGDSDGMVVNGRYAIKNPITGRDATWQRASNFGAPLADSHAINRWKMRELIRGLNRREDLVELIRTATEISNTQADEWIASALAAAATDAKANRGTAVHEVLRAYDTGQQYSERYQHIVNGYGAELDRQGLTPVGVEFAVLNVPLGAAGRADRVYRERCGTYVLGDVKTGRLDYAVHEFAVQCAVYGTAGYLVDDQGVARPLPWVLRQDYAVLVHVDPDTGESSTYRIDLTLGRRAANLAVQVRAWRNTKDVALPYVPPDAADEPRGQGVAATAVPPAGLVSGLPEGATQLVGAGVAGPIQHHTQTASVPSAAEQAVADVRARSTALGYAPDVQLTAEHVARVNAGIAPGRTVTTVTVPTPNAAVAQLGNGPVVFVDGLNPVQVENLAVPGDGPRAGIDVDGWAGEGATARAVANTEPPAIDPETEAAELAKLPKAELQRMLKALGGTDLAHHRSWLANEIVKRKNAAMADGTPTGLDSFNGVPMPQPATAAVVPAAEQTPHTLDLIRSAATVADIHRLREKIINVGGDRAWNDEMTEVARARVAELDEGNRQSVLARIDAATGSQELAALWAELTLSGTAPSQWTDEYQSRADARMASVNAAVVAAPPVNPFAN